MLGADWPGNGEIYIALGDTIVDTIPPATSTPEPASIALFGTAFVGLGAMVRRRKAR